MARPRLLICRDCSSPFTPYPGKPGLINQCPACAEDVPLLGGNMIWSHKTAPELEIKSLTQARAFAKLQQRWGAGPLRSIVQGKEPPSSANYSKQGSGAEAGAVYYSKLGEKRNVKR